MVETRLQGAVEQAQFLARTTAIELGRIRSRDGGAGVLCNASSSCSRPAIRRRRSRSCRSAAPCAGGDAGAPRLRLPRHASPPGRGRMSNRPTRFPQWVPCAGYAGLIAYALTPSAGAGRSAQRPDLLAVRAAAFARGPVAALRRRSRPARRRADVSRLRAKPASSCASHLGARPNGRGAVSRREPARARSARPADAGRTSSSRRGSCSPSSPTGRPARPGTRRVSIGMSIGEIYDRLSPSWRRPDRHAASARSSSSWSSSSACCSC